MKGDKRIVNCVEQHPSGIVVASSGIENDIKIWEPDDDLYIETDGSVEDIDTSEDSSEEDEDSDNSAKEDGDGDNSGKDMSDG
ncbi:hypothetical protein PR202_gb28493 [Eleusine coracana subsp. coracana]|uniref:Uncharacterized protein n=1 Tax=Eleusine coracana subsp. coracana TaxID=191504 RepID=A0AAV5FXE7_ELECO|nr:hypothetical protein PR202_gb28493 [Eleusine coracana subsp. coracana]